ncbi:MAG: DNA gyrase subunit A [Bacteroidales bacterium]|nr:DNA gyrase subunit A [Bacteroidales bacterium]
MSEQQERIIKINIENEMKSAYIDYSMSVIVSRALPDVRDGLKPVQRRVLYGMNELGLHHSKSHKKSARIVGEVLGKFHPHGDSSVYAAMVRMAQIWSLRYPTIDGQGNFGSIDDDSPAAMRYTEARLQRISDFMLNDLDKETVDMQPNFDESMTEPTVLPTRVPNLLINGASGIAVGMATNMPPHNLTDTIDSIMAYVDNKDIEIESLIEIIKAPDFPTGGIIYGYQGVKDAYLTGRGRIVVRGKYHIEETSSGKPRIVFSEIPYQVNKAAEIKKIGELANDGKIDGIVHANDESDRNGMRIVITCKRDAIPNVIINKIFKYTQLQSSFSVNNIALVKGRPQLLNLKEIIENFVEHRIDVIVRRTIYELRKAEEQAHILEGYLIALDHLDEVIKLIRNSANPEIAKAGLIENFQLSEIQAGAILQLRLQRLTGMERDKIKNEYEELMKLIEYLKQILADEALRYQIVKDELQEVKDKFGDNRRTEIQYSTAEFNPEDFYADEDVVITISNLGYMKRTPLTEYRTQKRGGTGAKGVVTREEDFVRYVFIASMHNTMLIFTDHGKCFWMKVYEIPEGSRTSKGRHIQNLLQIESDDEVMAYLNVPNLTDEQFLNNNYIILATQNGIVKKTLLKEYSRPRKNGINAINVRENDRLLAAKLTNGKNEVFLANRSGKAIRFNESLVRPMGRNASGVKGMKISETDQIIGMVCVENDERHILVVSENGYGKRSKVEDYRVTGRGGKGVKTLNVTEKTGKLVAIKDVTDDDDLMIMTEAGLSIRISVDKIGLYSRATQGVRLINLKDDDAIASVAKIENGNDHNEDAENEENQDIVVTNPEETDFIEESDDEQDTNDIEIIEEIDNDDDNIE